MLDALLTYLEQVGLNLNASKTKVSTTQAQPPSTLTTRAGLELEVWSRQNRTNGLAAFFQRSARAIDNKI